MAQAAHDAGGGLPSRPGGGGVIGRLADNIGGTTLSLIAVVFSSQLHVTLGYAIFTEQALSAILGCALAMIFVRAPARRGAARDRLPWYDLVFAVLALAAALYLTILYPSLVDQFYARRNEAFAIGIVLVPLTIEALRRTAGWGLTAIVVAFVLYGLVGDAIPGKLQARVQSPYQLASYLAVDPVAILGLPMTIVCTVVVMYVFFGQLLLKTGGSEWFTDIATALMGRSRGGAAKIAIFASGLFGSISGSAVSNVVSTGVITIPLMRQAGYDAKTAGAFEAVASTGGQIMPPIMGAAAFLMAEILQIPYADVVVAAIVPALLYYVAVFIYADLEAARKNIAPVAAERIPPLLRALREGWFFLIPFAVLVHALFWRHLSPEESALWASGAIVAVNWAFGYKGRRIGPKAIYESVRETGVAAVDIVVIGAMAGIIIGVIEVSGLGFGLTFILVQFGQGNLAGLLVLTALICIVLGMGMPTTAVYLLVAVLAAPPLIELNVNPLAAHMFVFYFGIVSLITPPVAVAAYVAASLARAGAMETAVTSVRLGWTALVVPVMFVMSPDLIMQGTFVDSALAFVTAIAGVWITTAGILGYLVRPMGWLRRAGFLVAGIALLIPAKSFAGAEAIELVGVALGAALIGNELVVRRRLRMA
ncbi:MAG: TRAP transporter permease [Rhodospirillales bacterium]